MTNSIKEEFSKYIGSEEECVHDSCGDKEYGNSITEGSYEGDMGWLEHYWDPDTDEGMCVSTGYCYDTAYEKSLRLWEESIEEYENGDYNKSYYLLGKVAHILEDISSPAHVHLDKHWGGPYRDRDSYEDYISENYKNYHSSGSSVFFNDLFSLFYNLAETADDFDSDDVCGEVDKCSRIYRCDALGYCDINTENSSEIAEVLMPLAIEHVTGLYRLFWINVNENVESCGQEGDEIGEDNFCCDKMIKIADRVCIEEYERDFIKVILPDKEIYNNKRISVDIKTKEEVDKIFLELKGKEIILCNECSSYAGFVSFIEGINEGYFKAVRGDKIYEKKFKFLVDSINPLVYYVESGIFITEYTKFKFEFKEENPIEIKMRYEDSEKIFGLEDCDWRNETYNCEIYLDRREIERFNNKRIGYWFEIKDIAGNKGYSRKMRGWVKIIGNLEEMIKELGEEIEEIPDGILDLIPYLFSTTKIFAV